jgi:hypothetical protein
MTRTEIKERDQANNLVATYIQGGSRLDVVVRTSLSILRVLVSGTEIETVERCRAGRGAMPGVR